MQCIVYICIQKNVLSTMLLIYHDNSANEKYIMFIGKQTFPPVTLMPKFVQIYVGKPFIIIIY